MTTTPTDDRPTGREFYDSLTGFDEIAIRKAFGVTVTALGDEKAPTGDPTMFARSLRFVAFRREGLSDAEAKEAVLALPWRDVDGYFADDVEAMPDDPTTESGKDDRRP